MKKAILILLLIALVMGGAFAQKHEAGDHLLGINLGFGFGANIFGLHDSDGNLNDGAYNVFTTDFGLSYDFYALNWLSVGTGVIFRTEINGFVDSTNDSAKLSDIITCPVLLTIPVMAHFNIPGAQWLYLGAGATFNIPMFSLLDAAFTSASRRFLGDTRGKLFFGVPIDVGFDFVRSKPRRGGMRLFFRLTPEFHEHGTTWPLTLTWQIWNFQLNKNR
jgi:hypothetical protein